MSSDLTLQRLSSLSNQSFSKPTKRIHDGADVSFFLTSLAYRDIVTFILQLNRSVVPRKVVVGDVTNIKTWPLGSEDVIFSGPILQLQSLLSRLKELIATAPPDPGPRRFGNVSFRKWFKLAEDESITLLKTLLSLPSDFAYEEVGAYLLGSFGSPQRLDYGTGHELSFLAFLAGLWKLDYFAKAESGVEERAIVLGVFETYLDLIRTLIKTYNLEPAGSHGVWGLDDNSFLPYIFGSAQLCPAITETEETPIEGSISDAPEPSSVAKSNLVDKEKAHNMYFSAIAFIYDVKRGPFWEHSPMLYDISDIKKGWGKINKGMIKMYNAEVLSKFPVVQHFPFGSLFAWEKDPEAKEAPITTHTSNQPLRNPMDAPGASHPGISQRDTTAAPWATRPPAAPVGFVSGVTQAPWANRTTAPPPPRGGFRGGPRLHEPTIPENSK